jgi:inorganic pyrophosphatase
MSMIDSGDRDDKIIAVPKDDPRWTDTKDLKDINAHTLKEIEHFYSTYKKLQNKVVEVTGFKGQKEAIEAFERGQKLYQEAKATK